MQKSLHMYIRICMHVLSLPLHLPHGVAKTTPPQIRFKHVLAGPVEEMHCWTKAVLRPKLPIWQPATFEHVSMCAWMYAWTHSMHANNLACCLGLQPGEDGQVALVPAIHTCMKQMHGMNAFQTNYIYIFNMQALLFCAGCLGRAFWAGGGTGGHHGAGACCGFGGGGGGTAGAGGRFTAGTAGGAGGRLCPKRSFGSITLTGRGGGSIGFGAGAGGGAGTITGGLGGTGGLAGMEGCPLGLDACFAAGLICTLYFGAGGLNVSSGGPSDSSSSSFASTFFLSSCRNKKSGSQSGLSGGGTQSGIPGTTPYLIHRSRYICFKSLVPSTIRSTSSTGISVFFWYSS